MVVKKLVLMVSDPWDFEVENGFTSFEVRVERVSEEKFLLKSETPVEVDGSFFRWFVCSPRFDGAKVSELQSGALDCSVICLDDEKVLGEAPFDLSWWRGGGALIGTLKVGF